jgi:WD40 repeat protein
MNLAKCEAACQSNDRCEGIVMEKTNDPTKAVKCWRYADIVLSECRATDYNLWLKRASPPTPAPSNATWSLKSAMEFKSEKFAIFSVVMSKDAKWLAAQDDGKKVDVYALDGRSQPKLVTSLGSQFQNEASRVAFSEDSKLVVLGDAGSVRGYTLQEGAAPKSKFNHTLKQDATQLGQIALSPDSKWLAAATRKGQLSLYALEGGKATLHGNSSIGAIAWEGRQLDFSADGKWLISYGACEKLCIFVYALNNLESKGESRHFLKIAESESIINI